VSRQLTASVLLIVDGLFTGVLWTLAIERVWIWREMDERAFADDFRNSIRRVDVVQPVFGLVATALAAYYAAKVSGSAQWLAFIGTALLVTVMVASVAVGVPLQKRLRAPQPDDLDISSNVLEIRRVWCRMHLVRTACGVSAFALLVVAVLYP
jgi:FtsH-binding integral membrane protein